MTAVQQDRERVRAGMLGLLGLAVAALCAGLVAVAWWLVVPPPRGPRGLAPSPLQHELFDRAGAAAAAHAAGLHQLQRTEWIDRKAGLVRIPIDRAIDAVVADPSLIGARAAAVPHDPATRVGELGR
jgi:hypothetical protein